MLSTAAKDLRIFFRDRRNLFLVAVTPFFLMVVFGNLFQDEPPETYLRNIKIGLCNHDPNFKLPDYFSTVSPEDCERTTMEMVAEGRIRGTLIVPENFSGDIREGLGSTVTLYLDNSKPQTSFTLRTSIEAYINRLNEEIGSAFIGEAWVRLSIFNKKLKVVVKQLEFSRVAAESIRESTDELIESIAGINLSQAYLSINITDSALSEIQENINETQRTLNLTSAIIEIQKQILERALNLTGIRISEGYANATLYSLETIYRIECLECNETCNKSTEICRDINLSLGGMESFLKNISEADRILSEDSLQLYNLSHSALEILFNYTGRLNETASSLESENFTYLYENLDMVNGIMAEVERINNLSRGKLLEIREIIGNVTAEIIALHDELNRTTVLLDEYTEREPRTIVRAVTLSSENAFSGGKGFRFAAPGLMMVVLMFITLLVSAQAVVSEKGSRTMFRTVLAPAPLWVFLFQKMLALCVLCIIEFAVMLLTLVLFDVYLPVSFQMAAVVITASISFITLGMVIGALSKSENTSLLASLVVSIPMLFLSGALISFESMPPMMNMIASYSVLTLCIQNMENVLTYVTGIQLFILVRIGLFSLVCFLLMVHLLKRSPMIE